MLRAWLTGFAFCLLMLAGCAGENAPPPPDPSHTITLTSGWEFRRGPPDELVRVSDLPEEGWQAVSLPHTANLEPRIVNDQWQGDAFYRRTITPEEAWVGKSVWLRFEGAMNVAEVYVNGAKVATHLGGYLPFTVDLTDAVEAGEPIDLLVHLDNRDNAITGPKPLKLLDFNMYGGLYREVTLSIHDRLHITDEMLSDTPAGGGVFVTYPEVSAEEARVAVATEVENAGATPRSYTLRQRLMRNGDVVAQAERRAILLAAGDRMTTHLSLDVPQPALWSPAKPNLYTLVSEVLDRDQVVDSRRTRIGIRRFEMTPEGFAINGEPLFLRGVNRHQEYPYVGYALSPNADYRDAKLIKEAGFDYVRLSHYPHSPHFMAAADELGLLLLDAIPGWQYASEDPAFVAQVLDTCRDMIRRDRNHPSVLAWECSLNESWMKGDLVPRFHDMVHAEYPGDQAWSAGWVPETYDIYLQARQHRLPHPDQVLPEKPYIVSEYGDWEYFAQNAGLNQEDWADLSETARTSRQLLSDGEVRLLQQARNIQEAHNDNLTTPAFADGYWDMFDYNRGYATDLEASGIASLERVTKPAYQFFRSQRDADETSPDWDGGPMVYIANEWTEKSPLDIRVFSNAERVELQVNGRTLKVQDSDKDDLSTHLAHPPFTFHLDRFEPGELTAIAYIGGSQVARHTVLTPGAAQGVEARLVTLDVAPVAGDLLFVHARVVDGRGTTVPRNGINVMFDLGAGLVPVGPLVMPSENGIAATLVRVADPGDVTVAAQLSEPVGGLDVVP
ncbi:MAG: glycoside hydrolase family 2 TIM barrel-domain containing protein [Hyphomonas sp.]|uniref:glycoside hydrolase family 2 TIM barrel-domain containing protein n=1 Tax=Hyphomonas sp. TaxID=87 RepID=UPI003527AC12